MARILSTTDLDGSHVEVVVDIGPARTVTVVMSRAAYLTDGADVVADKAVAYYASRNDRPRRPK